MLELDALLAKLEQLAAEGNRGHYDTDERYRWVIHRLWIAVGNEVAHLDREGAPRDRVAGAVEEELGEGLSGAGAGPGDPLSVDCGQLVAFPGTVSENNRPGLSLS